MVLLLGVVTEVFAVTRGDSVARVVPWRLPDVDYVIQSIIFALVGAVIASRRPQNLLWLVLSVFGFESIMFGLSNEYTIYALLRQPGSLPGGQVTTWFSTWAFQPIPTLTALIFFLFPTGRPASRRWAWGLWLLPLYFVLGWIPPAFLPGWTQNTVPIGDGGPIHNPLAIRAAEPLLQMAVNASNVVLAAAFVLAIASLVARYRRGEAVERQQLRLFVFAAAVSPLGFLLYPVYSGPDAFKPIGLAALAVSSIGIDGLPIAIGIAILRYRLFDIDVVINRALVYGALAAFITAIYVAIVVGVGTLVGSGGRPNLVLSIIATAAVAVAFQPVRERLQRVANMMIYGRRASPYEILSQFSERVGETYAAEDALPRMARVLAEGTGAERAEVWLRTGDTIRPAASWPEPGGTATAEEPVALTGDSLPSLGDASAVAVRHQGQLLGALTVTKRQGESLTPIEQKLLDDLARQAGLVLKNVGLTAELLARLEELRASRKRLVTAQDEERRRLERNLHDGAQQNLVALKVKLGLAETLMDRDPAKAMTMLAEVKSETTEALETLRDLARGIYPPLLADNGLVAALEAHARKATVAVEVVATDVTRYPREVEAAVYFCCLEALQNVQKYAATDHAVVTLEASDGHLDFTVRDDGRGFDSGAAKRGAGLTNMADRINALGGTLVVVSAPGDGTRVDGSVPVAAAIGHHGDG